MVNQMEEQNGGDSFYFMKKIERRLIFILPTIPIYLLIGIKIAMIYLIVVNIGIYIYENRKSLKKDN